MKKVAILGLTAVIAANSFAGVKEKKAQRAGDEAITAQTEQTVAACGIASLEVTLDWGNYEQLFTDSAQAMIDKGYDAENIIKDSSDRAVNTLNALARICNADEDYKAEIANLTQVVITPKADINDYQSEFSLDGTTLQVANGHYMTRYPSEFEDRLKALY